MKFNIGISGATGVTGEVALRILEQRSFSVGRLCLFASKSSVGQVIRWRGVDHVVEALEDGNFSGLDLVISRTSSAIAREWIPRMVQAGAIVIDQSFAFRSDPSVPLVIPEINGDDLGSHQAISGRGREGISEFLQASAEALNQIEGLRGHAMLALPEPLQFPHQSAFNIFPHCEDFKDGSDTSTEEEKMQAEMRKILHDDGISVHATAVRVPVLVGHTTSLAISLGRPAKVEEIRRTIQVFPGVKVLDEPSTGKYPTPLAAAHSQFFLNPDGPSRYHTFSEH